MCFFLFSSVLPLPVLFPSSGYGAVSTQEIMGRLQAAYRDVKDITLDFTQKSAIEGFEEKVFEGRLYLKKTEQVRWDYLRPVKQNIYISGDKVILYLPEERQAIVQTLSGHPDAEPAMGLLTNIEKWNDLFFIRGDGEEGDFFKIELRPKTMLLIEKVLVGIHKETHYISRLTLFEKSGSRVSFYFSNIKTNSGLKDSLFDFKIPKGTEILEY